MEKLSKTNFSKFGGKNVHIKLKNGKELNAFVEFIFWEGDDDEDHQIITQYRVILFKDVEGIEIIE